ncbi:MAG: hypothetical protein AB7T58_00495 [Hyphomonadaceae bacterium]
MFVAFYRRATKWSDSAVREEAVLRQREYMSEGARRGLVLRAGGLGGDGEFLVTLVAPSMTVAQRFIARDPSVKSGVYLASVRRFESDYVSRA